MMRARNFCGEFHVDTAGAAKEEKYDLLKIIIAPENRECHKAALLNTIYAFRFKEFGLLPWAAEGKLSGERAPGVDDTEAGDVVRIRILVQCVSDGARFFLLPASSATCE